MRTLKQIENEMHAVLLKSGINWKQVKLLKLEWKEANYVLHNYKRQSTETHNQYEIEKWFND